MAEGGKLGLALSGGGFRAAAFHLGVLKRLRELGLLQQVDVISTVSGGSIIGAFWVHWQSRTKSDPPPDPDGTRDWTEFESAMIRLMRAGLIVKVVGWGFGLPFGYGVILALTLWLAPDTLWPLLPAAILALLYFGWQHDLGRRGLRGPIMPFLMPAFAILIFVGGVGHPFLFSEPVAESQKVNDEAINWLRSFLLNADTWVWWAVVAIPAISGALFAIFWLWRRRLLHSDWERAGKSPKPNFLAYSLAVIAVLVSFFGFLALMIALFQPGMISVLERPLVALSTGTRISILIAGAVAVLPVAHGYFLYRLPERGPTQINTDALSSTTLISLLLLGAIVALLSWPPSFWSVTILLLTISIYAYFCWHYNSSVLLQWLYDRELYARTSMRDLAAEKPVLMINATSLVFGEQFVFTPNYDLSDAVSGKGATTGRSRPVIEFAPTVPLATAVAASSAFPAVFTPVLIRGHEAKIAAYGRTADEAVVEGPYYASDGGVYDNQGIQALLETDCARVIVSDGAIAFAFSSAPSTWQLFPIGSGVLNRCRDIIFQRVRDLGYRVLRSEPRAIRSTPDTEITTAAGDDRREIAYVELEPVARFTQGPLMLPPGLFKYLARLRTDLDSFSDLEISALAYHGYSLIDRCIMNYHPHWVGTDKTPFAFSLPGLKDFAWSKVAGENGDSKLAAQYARELDASDTRISLWRPVRRFLNCMTADDGWLHPPAPR